MTQITQLMRSDEGSSGRDRDLDGVRGKISRERETEIKRQK